MGVGPPLVGTGANVWGRFLGDAARPNGVTAIGLIAVALTGVLTTLSVLLFGATRSKREGS